MSTLAEKEAEIRELFHEPMYSDFELELRELDNGYSLRVSQMYEYVRFSDDISFLKGMHEICRILDCTEGDEESRYHRGGCCTCDYGSNYTINWRFW